MGTSNIADKVVVITGPSSGIGESTARLLARHGAKVVLGARRKDRICASSTEWRFLATRSRPLSPTPLNNQPMSKSTMSSYGLQHRTSNAETPSGRHNVLMIVP